MELIDSYIALEESYNNLIISLNGKYNDVLHIIFEEYKHSNIANISLNDYDIMYCGSLIANEYKLINSIDKTQIIYYDDIINDYYDLYDYIELHINTYITSDIMNVYDEIHNIVTNISTLKNYIKIVYITNNNIRTELYKWYWRNNLLDIKFDIILPFNSNTIEQALNRIYLYDDYEITYIDTNKIKTITQFENNDYIINFSLNLMHPNGYHPKYNINIINKQLCCDIKYHNEFDKNQRVIIDEIHSDMLDFIDNFIKKIFD